MKNRGMTENRFILKNSETGGTCDQDERDPDCDQPVDCNLNFDSSESDSDDGYEVVTVVTKVCRGGPCVNIEDSAESERLMEDCEDISSTSSAQDCSSIVHNVSQGTAVQNLEQDQVNSRSVKYPPFSRNSSSESEVHGEAIADEGICPEPETEAEESDLDDVCGQESDSQGSRQRSGTIFNMGEKGDIMDACEGESSSSGVTKELEFTLDHFGEDVTQLGVFENSLASICDDKSEATESIPNVPPLFASTANRENSEPESLERKARKNRGVPRTRLDL